jgi:two-component system, response regulator YesN
VTGVQTCALPIWLIGESCADYVTLRQRKGGKRMCTREEELELSSLLLRNDRLALHSWVQQFIINRTDDPHMTIESLDASIRSVSETAQRWLQRGFVMSGREQYAEESPPPASFKKGEFPKDTLLRYLYAMMKLYHARFGEGQTNHVHKAMAYIQEHVEDDIGLQQAAKYVHVHPNHLSELFRKETGTTFGEYVTNLKIERAKELLASSPAKISEVAYRLGYEDVKYFGQLFKKCTGKTPSEFRIDYKG